MKSDIEDLQEKLIEQEGELQWWNEMIEGSKVQRREIQESRAIGVPIGKINELLAKNDQMICDSEAQRATIAKRCFDIRQLIRDMA